MEFLKRLWGRLNRRGTFKVIVREPFGGPAITKTLPCDGRTLFSHFYDDESWKTVASATANGEPIVGWAYHVPKKGETIEIKPGAGVKSFTEAYIRKLNAEQGGGKFLKAIILTESLSPLIFKYFVDHPTPIVFNGNTYQPLSMSWQDFEVTREMNFPTMKVTVPNIGGEVVDYVERLNILENDVVLQLLHYDLLGDVNAKDELGLQIQMIEGDDTVAQFTLGYNLGFQDVLPRKVVLRSEFPGLVETYTRFRG